MKNGKQHNDPLHIMVDAKGKRIPTVLIDDGSALNVCPLKAASFLGLSFEDFVPKDQHVKAYDNSRKEVNVQNVYKTPMNVQTPNLQITNSSLSTNNVRAENVNKLKHN